MGVDVEIPIWFCAAINKSINEAYLNIEPWTEVQNEPKHKFRKFIIHANRVEYVLEIAILETDIVIWSIVGRGMCAL